MQLHDVNTLCLGHFKQLVPEPYHDVVIPREAPSCMEVVVQVLCTERIQKRLKTEEKTLHI